MENETATQANGPEGYAGEGPKWRIEHASSGQATCQQAACKRAQIKIAKGELRIGTHTLFARDEEQRWYMAWRHWGCATKHQIQGLVEVTENDPTRAPGYDRLSPEAQEQVQLAFENGGVVDKEFKGVNTELAKVAKRYGGDIVNATGYKVDIATRGTASCRKSDCPAGAVKIAKGELRLGISVPFDGEHESWVYKHWKCISMYDVDALMHIDGPPDGFDALPEEHQEVVFHTLNTGEVVEPPPPPPATKPTRARKKKVEGDDSEAEPPKPKRKSKAKAKKTEDTDDSDDAPEAKPKPKAKRKGKKRSSDEVDENSEPEYVPKKTRSRAKPLEEEVDPTVAHIQAMAEDMRMEAAK